MVFLYGLDHCHNGGVGNDLPPYQGGYIMSGRLVTVLVILAVGYILGVKFPQLAGKIGIA